MSIKVHEFMWDELIMITFCSDEDIVTVNHCVYINVTQKGMMQIN